MKKKSRSQKLLMKTILALISSLLLASSAWISDFDWKSTPPQTKESPLFFSNQTGDNLEKNYLAAIQRAEKSILLMIFAVTNDNILEALRQKSHEGVAVKVICDAKASPHIVKKLGPQVEVIRRLGKGLMHLKVLTIDEKECWIGSANFTNESLNMHGNLVVAFADETLASTISKKGESLQEYERTEDIPPQQFQVGGQIVELSFLPDDKNAVLRIKQLIRGAKKTIRVAMYTWTRYDLAKEIIQAQKRGVDVEVAIDRSSSKGSSAKVAEMLHEAGVPLYCSTGAALLHHKFLWIDDETLEVGSANWTKAAFTLNDDCFLILRSLNEKQKQQMKKLWDTIKQDGQEWAKS